ncbi:adenylate cyclase [Malassezia caprae]|uniref:Adenylate cyclase n=1 Tax=Malassezia caprae TaxID=1381934 RepID=A0AAF0IVK3_9BASI|nr:adenylate cyclase [Malassezia caprae]
MDDAMPASSAGRSPHGIIDQHINQLKSEEEQLTNTVSPWESGDVDEVSPGTTPVRRRLNPFYLFRSSEGRRASATGDGRRWIPLRSSNDDRSRSRSRSDAGRMPRGTHRLPTHSPVRGPSVEDARPVGLLEPLSVMRSHESTHSHTGSIQGIRLDTNMDNIDDIVDTSRLVRAEGTPSGERLRSSSAGSVVLPPVTPQVLSDDARASMGETLSPYDSSNISPRPSLSQDEHNSPTNSIPGSLALRASLSITEPSTEERRSSSPRPAPPLLLPTMGMAPVSSPSAWTAPPSWAVVSNESEREAMKNVGSEYADDDTAPSSNEYADDASGSLQSSIVIFEPEPSTAKVRSAPPICHKCTVYPISESRRGVRRFWRTPKHHHDHATEHEHEADSSKKSAPARRRRAQNLRFLLGWSGASRDAERLERAEPLPNANVALPAPLEMRTSDMDMSMLQGRTFLRVYQPNETYVLLSCAPESTTAEMLCALGQHVAMADPQGYRLFLYERGMDRPLTATERPARIIRRRLLQAGYTEADDLDGLGRQDLSCLLRFVYRADRFPTLPVEQEQTYKHLNLQAMHLTLIPVPVYRIASSIVSLDLSMNPLADLPLDFAQQLTSLRILRLASLALKRVPASVCAILSLTQIDVSSNRLLDLDHIPLDQLPQLRVVRATNNRLSKLPAYMAPMMFLEYVNLSNNRFDTFPDILCAMPNLVDLDLSFNTIRSLPPDIGRLSKLVRLVLAGNRLSSLPAEMRGLTSLRLIDLRHMTLQSIDDLPALPKLERLVATHNCLTSIDSALGASLSQLELTHNPLSRAALQAPAASALTRLDLSHASLVTLPDSLLSSVPALRRLVLDGNQLGALPALGALTRLEMLSCAANALTGVPESIGALGALVQLDLHDNNVRTLPASLWACSALRELNVSSNLLDGIPLPPPTEVPRELTHLYLADNRLSEDVLVILTSLPRLEVLNLSMNEIFEVPTGALRGVRALRELYLSGNALSALPADDLEHLTQLRVLFLNGNRLHSLPAELGRLKQLRAIDVGDNVLKYNIANFNYEWNWNTNPELRHLNLSGNQHFEIRPKLTDIDGRGKNIADFNSLHHLRLLGLMEVTMTHQSLPDDSDHRRVRTTLAQVNDMPYAIADSIGRLHSFHVFDLVVPQFRGTDDEALLGLIEGHSTSNTAAARISHYIRQHCVSTLSDELTRVPSTATDEDVATALRRTFLRLNQSYAAHVLQKHEAYATEQLRSDPQAGSHLNLSQEVFWGWGTASSSPDTHLWHASATALFAYLRGRTLYVANVGESVAVLSRAGVNIKVLGTKHDPLDHDETQRIRAAEGWVSPNGRVNDKLDVARALGAYHLTPVVTAAPSIVCVPLLDMDEFVIIANSELWCYMSYQMAVDIARMDRENPRVAASRLRDTAIAYGASKHVSVMVLTVGALFDENLNAHVQTARAAQSRLGLTKKTRRGRMDMDSTLARLDREVLPPIGQVALVFTDIKSSTLLWETNPSMQAAIRLHNLLLRRQLRSIGGYEVKTEGDAFMASFSSVASALLWCFTVQMRLLSVDWPQAILDTPATKVVHAEDGSVLYRGLRVRMGIHWGWPVCEVDPVNNRMDYFGPMVNRAARISAAADGGQILVSQDVVDELERQFQQCGDEPVPSEESSEVPSVDEPHRDVVLLRRLGLGIIATGERRLRGIESPERLSLVYPKSLSERYSHLAGSRTSTGSLLIFEPTQALLALGQIKQLGYLCLRLEALSNRRCFPGIAPADPLSRHVQQEIPTSNLGPVPCSDRSLLVQRCIHRMPELLAIEAREDATDAELVPILSQLITRIRNAVSSLTVDYARQAMGGLEAQRALQMLLADLDPGTASPLSSTSSGSVE